MTVKTPLPLEYLFPIEASTDFNPESYRHRILFGEPKFNIPGIFNHPEIPRFFACYTNDIPDREVAWHKIISTSLNSLETLTMCMEQPDSLLLPYWLNPSVSLLTALQGMNIKSIGVLPELGKAFMPHGDTALIYTKNKCKFEIFVDHNKCEVALYRPHSLAFILGI
jgi:hypothetical protein